MLCCRALTTGMVQPGRKKVRSVYVIDEQSTYPDKGKVCDIQLCRALWKPRRDGDGKVFVRWIVPLIVYWLVRALIQHVAKGV
jgi:hypothetical protein